MPDDIFERRASAKATVSEIEQKKQQHLRMIEEKERNLIDRRSLNNSQSEEKRAELFFLGRDEGQDLTSLETEILKLHEQTKLFDLEIARRGKLLNALAGEYQAAVWAPIKKLDDANKVEMADLLIRLAKCCEREIAHVDQAREADTSPPASFRPMRPNFIGTLNDPNSFVSLWLRELGTYYPHVKVKVDG